MLHDESAPTCSLCLDGVPVGVVPSGPCRGKPACARCLDALTEALPVDELRDEEPFVDDTGLEEERYERRVAARGWQ